MAHTYLPVIILSHWRIVTFGRDHWASAADMAGNSTEADSDNVHNEHNLVSDKCGFMLSLYAKVH